jgi:hypothetical protein
MVFDGKLKRGRRGEPEVDDIGADRFEGGARDLVEERTRYAAVAAKHDRSRPASRVPERPSAKRRRVPGDDIG